MHRELRCKRSCLFEVFTDFDHLSYSHCVTHICVHIFLVKNIKLWDQRMGWRNCSKFSVINRFVSATFTALLKRTKLALISSRLLSYLSITREINAPRSMSRSSERKFSTGLCGLTRAIDMVCDEKHPSMLHSSERNPLMPHWRFLQRKWETHRSLEIRRDS